MGAIAQYQYLSTLPVVMGLVWDNYSHALLVARCSTGVYVGANTDVFNETYKSHTKRQLLAESDMTSAGLYQPRR